jgi:flagellar biosynthesis protein FlhA
MGRLSKSDNMFSILLARTDVLVSSGIILILMIMIIPLPTVFLDFFLAINISLSIIVLLVAFYTFKPLDFAVFPGMLLILTLFRLSLNVASTRLILGQGYAGKLIQAFGSFVVHGNFVLGIIIFAVLIIINFIVITKGASRIAEVSARFTLDAMPGKQMAIDADLNAGLITDEQARKMRDEIARESDFYGAMDGASKFVRGDVIAGLLITFINIIGGLIIGTVQRGMSISNAAHVYTLLTIGDGLVSQIPALLISTASGIIVSRAASEGNLGEEMTGQLINNPRTIMIASIFIFIIGMIPGMPIIPFWSISGILLFVSIKNFKKQQADEEEENNQKQLADKEEERVEDYLLMDTLELEIGYSLIPLVDPDQGGDLLDRMASLRKQLAIELGIIVPPIRIRDNIQLNANDYVIKMRGIVHGQGDLLPGYYMALIPADFDIELPGIKTTDPTFGMDAVWVSSKNRSQVEKYGISAIESGAVITTHLMELIKRKAYKIIDRQMVKQLIDNVKEASPALIEELIPEVLKLGEIQKVLKRLLKERIPVRDLITILETLADQAAHTKNTDVLTEYVRAALSDTITKQFRNDNGEINVAVLDSPIESHLINQAQQGNLNPTTLGFTPETIEKLYVNCTKIFEKMIANGHDPILLTSPVLRPTLYDFLISVIPEITVLSYNDISLTTKISKFDRITLSMETIESPALS